MPKVPDLTTIERGQIFALHDSGVSLSDLAVRYKCNRRTISRICSRYKTTKSFFNSKRSGRPKKFTDREDRALKNLQLKCNRLSSRAVAAQFTNQHNVSISSSTVRKRMKHFSLPSRIARKKPFISSANRTKRLNWCKAHKDWTPEQWNAVIFSDETPVHIVQNNQKRRIRCFKSELLKPNNIRPTLHSGGGKISIWVCFYSAKVGPVIQISDRTTARDYLELLNSFFMST